MKNACYTCTHSEIANGICKKENAYSSSPEGMVVAHCPDFERFAIGYGYGYGRDRAVTKPETPPLVEFGFILGKITSSSASKFK